jgi:hypothetical protein
VYFGKSYYSVPTSLPEEELLERIWAWRHAHRLADMSRGMGVLHYRHGSRYFSNPIHIQIGFDEGEIRIAGWVQTGIRFVSWTLVDVDRESIWTLLDNRRRGGLLVHRLREALTA